MACLTRREIFLVYKQKSNAPILSKIAHVNSVILNKLSTSLRAIDKRETSETLRRLCYEFQRKTTKAHSLDDPKSPHKIWLDETIDFAVVPMPRGLGRPLTNFNLLSDSQKRRRVEKLRKSATTNELALATQINAREEGREDIARVIHDIFQDEGKAKAMRDAYSVVLEMKPGSHFSSNEALALYLNLDISRDEYQALRNALLAKNVPDLLPSYKVMHDALEKCLPDPAAMTITESSATVDLQALLDLTAKRLVEQHDVQLLQFGVR